MRKGTISTLLGMGGLLIMSPEQVHAADACAMFLCMAGEVQPTPAATSSCTPYIAAYFAITDPEPDTMAGLRDQALARCSGIDDGQNPYYRAKIYLDCGYSYGGCSQ